MDLPHRLVCLFHQLKKQMLNFLPQQNKKKIVSEYFLRIGVFLLLMIFASRAVLISLFEPSYIFVEYKNNTINNQLESVANKNKQKSEDPIAFIKNVNKLSTVFSTDNKSTVTYREILNKISTLKNRDIKLLSIVISNENNTGKKVLLTGTASTRDALTLFNNDLISDGFFNSVTFPISNFIMSSNSDFFATLTL